MLYTLVVPRHLTAYTGPNILKLREAAIPVGKPSAYRPVKNRVVVPLRTSRSIMNRMKMPELTNRRMSV